jgi:hypothetical protein
MFGKSKKDPMLSAIKGIMDKNDAHRKAVETVNEYFGITSRRALPLEEKAKYDIAVKKVLAGETIDDCVPAYKGMVQEGFGPDGRGIWKVNYVHPDKKNVGNDHFETEKEARRFAKSLKDKGYHDVTTHEGQRGSKLEETEKKKSREQINEVSKETLKSYLGKSKEKYKELVKADNNALTRRLRINPNKPGADAKEAKEEAIKADIRRKLKNKETFIPKAVEKIRNLKEDSIKEGSSIEKVLHKKKKSKLNKKLKLNEASKSVADARSALRKANTEGGDVKAAKKTLDDAVAAAREKRIAARNSIKEEILDVIIEERKESGRVIDAFLAKKSIKGKRTHTDGKALYLHGNKIAWHGDDDSVHATMAGWGTVTTRERLNTLANRLGAPRFSQRKGVQYHGDKEIGSHDHVVLKAPKQEKLIESHEYSKSAVDKAIKNSRKKISGKEAKLIHALLKGRQKSDEPTVKEEVVDPNLNIALLQQEIAESLMKKYNMVADSTKLAAFSETLTEEQATILKEYLGARKIAQLPGSPFAPNAPSMAKPFVGPEGLTIKNLPPPTTPAQSPTLTQTTAAPEKKGLFGFGGFPRSNPVSRPSPQTTTADQQFKDVRQKANDLMMHQKTDPVNTPAPTAKAGVFGMGGFPRPNPVPATAPQPAPAPTQTQTQTQQAAATAPTTTPSAPATTPATTPAAKSRSRVSRQKRVSAPMRPKRFGFGADGSGRQDAGSITNRALGAVNEEETAPRKSLESILRERYGH